MTFIGSVRNSLLLLLLSTGLKAQTAWDVCPLLVGDTIPYVEAQNVLEQGTHNFREAFGEGDYIFIFYRGEWCPYCQRHLAAIGRQKAMIDSLGYEIVGISPDMVNFGRALKEELALDYQLYADPEMKISNAFGLTFTVDDATLERYDGYGIDLEANSGQDHHQLPVPAVYIVRNGVIVFSYINPDYRQRLSEEVLIAVLKSIQ